MLFRSITTAQSSDHTPAWTGKDPADFGTDLALLTGKYGAISVKHAAALAATGGAADAKATAEAPLENSAYTVARALAGAGALAAATQKIPSTRYSRRRNAIAPSAIQEPSMRTRSLPASCLLTQLARKKA